MDLDFSEEQELLRNTLHGLCTDLVTPDVVRRMEKDERGFPADVWGTLAENGVTALRIDEDHGGVGMSCLDAVIAFEEFGQVLAPAPHFESAILSARLIALAGTDAQKETLLPQIAEGTAVIVPAWQEAGKSAHLDGLDMTAGANGDGVVLNGQKVLVPFAKGATHFAVLARHPSADGQFIVAVVAADADGLSLRAQPNHADAALYAVSFDTVSVGAGDIMGLDDGINSVWDQAFLEGLIVLAAQAVGGATRMLDMTTEYAKDRKQFGRPIGSFQAIAHYLADRAVELEGARNLVYQAAWAFDEGLKYEDLALMAKMKACAMFRKTAAVGVQVHGGLGFTSEADPQLYYRRAKHQQLMYGDPAWLDDRLADCVLADDFSVTTR